MDVGTVFVYTEHMCTVYWIRWIRLSCYYNKV